MAVNKLDYEQFRAEHSAINTCIQNIEAELNTANNNLQNATADASGQWAAADSEDWNQIYSDINVKFQKLQDLMQKAGVAMSSTEATENAYSGLGNTVQ